MLIRVGSCAAKRRPGVRAAVDAVKVVLGERGSVWWMNGEPDFNRRMVRNTPYAV